MTRRRPLALGIVFGLLTSTAIAAVVINDRDVQVEGPQTLEALLASVANGEVITRTAGTLGNATPPAGRFDSNPYLENPADYIANQNGSMQISRDLAHTLTTVRCSTDVGTVLLQLEERTAAAPNTTGANLITAPCTCAATGTVCTLVGDPTPDANDPVAVVLSTVTGGATILRAHVSASIP